VLPAGQLHGALGVRDVHYVVGTDSLAVKDDTLA